MIKLIKDILLLGVGVGEFMKFDFGMDESDWCVVEGKSGNYIVGWWEGKVGLVEFLEMVVDEVVWFVEGWIVLIDVEGNCKEFMLG